MVKNVVLEKEDVGLWLQVCITYYYDFYKIEYKYLCKFNLNI